MGLSQFVIFFCLASILSASLPPSFQTACVCPDKYVHLASDTEDLKNESEGLTKCYRFFDMELSFFEAVERCYDMNATLAAPDTKAEVKLISDYVVRNLSLPSRQYWIDVTTNTTDDITPTMTSNTEEMEIISKIMENLSNMSAEPTVEPCEEMVVWVVGKEDARWVQQLCNTKAHLMCQKKAALKIDGSYSIKNSDPTVTGPHSDHEIPLQLNEPTLIPNRECSLQCSSHTLRIACELRLFPEAINKTVVLYDPQCTAQTNGSHLIIHTGLDNCGTLAENSAQDKVVYRNALRVLNDNGDDGVFATEIMQVTCRYPSRNLITQTFGDGQQSNKGEINIPGELDPTSTTEDGSSFRHVSLIYKSDAYDCPIQPDEYPYTFSMTDNLYSEVRVLVPSEQIELHAVECFVTETKEITSESIRYNLLKNACPLEDTFELITETSSPKIERFSFNLMGIFQIFQEIFVHCEVILCTVSSASSSECPHQCTSSNQSDDISKRDLHKVPSKSFVTSNKIVIINNSIGLLHDEQQHKQQQPTADQIEPEQSEEAEHLVGSQKKNLSTRTTEEVQDEGNFPEPKREGLYRNGPHSPSKLPSFPKKENQVAGDESKDGSSGKSERNEN